MTRMLLVGILLVSFPLLSWSLDNGLALTPPMGWMSWERFRCNIDCANDPDNCISELLYMQMAELMVRKGYRDVGYEYVIIDDCWLATTRDSNGKLQADPIRFPSGIKVLADYIHTLGLKFGIYEDYGNYTCGGYPGILGHLETDANTFAEWGVDYVKIDGCYANMEDYPQGYPEFGKYLNQTGRPMVYSCSWPAYTVYAGLDTNYTAISAACNLWRNYGDIDDSWTTVEDIIDYYAETQDVLIPNAGPGHWNDPDMLIIGDFGLSFEQSKSQMAIWAIMASPLLMSVDFRTIQPEYQAILQNRQIISVNQDILGIQGRRIYESYGFEIWTKPITPVIDYAHSYAVAFLNRRTDGTSLDVSRVLQVLGLNFTGGYFVEDLFTDKVYGFLVPTSTIKIRVNPTGVVVLRFTVHTGKE